MAHKPKQSTVPNYLSWRSENVRPRRNTSLYLLGLLMLAGCTGTAREFNTLHLTLSPDQSQTIQLGLEQTLLVEIPSNPTTGYRWELVALTRERRCYIFQELPYTAGTGTDTQIKRVGAPTFQKWSIKIDKSFPCVHEQLIHWTYRRPWEPPGNQNATTEILLKPLLDSSLLSR